MEFDDLKRAWKECDSKLDGYIHLNPRRLRSSIRETAGAAINRRPRRDIDYSAPVVVTQKQLALRIEWNRDRKWMLRRAPLACALLMIAGIASLFGVNLYSVLGTAGLAVAVALALRAVAARINRSFLVCEFDGEEIAGKVQANLLRLRRRHRVLRG